MIRRGHKPYNSFGNGAAIAGGMAEAYYGIPSVIREKALVFLEDDLAEIVDEFERKYGK